MVIKMNIEEKVIACAAETYEMDAKNINLDTNIREELSNQSLLMIAFISGIEESMGAVIDLRDAAKLFTISDFAEKVKELLG